MNTLSELLAAARSAFSRRERSGARFGSQLDVYCGLETRTNPRTYRWDGLSRGGDPAHPSILFQYTLAGWGRFVDADGPVQRVGAERAFTALVPSNHLYYLPAESDKWSFFWMMMAHPYVTERLTNAMGHIGPVMTIAPASPLAARAIELFRSICLESTVDKFAHERLLFDFLIEYERHVEQSLYPQDNRQRMLDLVRGEVLSQLDRPVPIETIATKVGMSRSHFSHRFKATTGMSPARVITELRLAEVTRQLIDSDDSLKSIAARTGFADVNHLCKVFRRHHHLSPGAFRKQLR